MTSTVNATRKDAIDAACRIDGWLTSNEAGLLYDLARNADGSIVEIGSWRGRSTTALALGSMAGRKWRVTAIDPFIGPQEGWRPTSLGNEREAGCSPEMLRANLDGAGVNGLVRIVSKQSEDALAEAPKEIALLFVDGAHDYESVCRDIDNYLPRLKPGGLAVFHDVIPNDPGVVRAIDDRIMNRPNDFRLLDRVDSALVVRKVKTPRTVVGLACPGGSFGWGTVTQGIVQSSLGAHRVDLDNNSNGWDDFNSLWARALNRMEAGEITHFAMLHSDIIPAVGWIDLLMDEMQETGADLISVACAIKDKRGVLNCGFGDLGNRWGAFRRLTVRELLRMPPTFGLAQTQYPDKVLLHNTGCFVADLRRPVFTQADTEGRLRAWFDFPTQIRRNDAGQWAHDRESEDWFFSRKLHELGAKTLITRKVRLRHVGQAHFVNDEVWGSFENGDDDTRSLWEKKS